MPCESVVLSCALAHTEGNPTEMDLHLAEQNLRCRDLACEHVYSLEQQEQSRERIVLFQHCADIENSSHAVHDALSRMALRTPLDRVTQQVGSRMWVYSAAKGTTGLKAGPA